MHLPWHLIAAALAGITTLSLPSRPVRPPRQPANEGAADRTALDTIEYRNVLAHIAECKDNCAQCRQMARDLFDQRAEIQQRATDILAERDLLRDRYGALWEIYTRQVTTIEVAREYRDALIREEPVAPSTMVDRRAALLDALDALDYIEGLQTDIPRPQSPPLLPRQGTA